MSRPGVPAPAREGRWWLILSGSIAYLAVILGIMLWRGISIEPQWVVIALLLVALALGGGRQFVVDWAPFVVLFLAYEALGGAPGGTTVVPHDLGPAELRLFGLLPTVWLQRYLYDAARISPLDWIATALYFMHFVIPIVAGFCFWVRSRQHYWRFISALLLMSLLAFLTYLFFPSAPPGGSTQARSTR
jgi:hypothetical protein